MKKEEILKINSDCSKEMIRLYKILWEKLPNINDFDKYYGGETIHSYNTLFGTLRNSCTVAELFEFVAPKFSKQLVDFKQLVYSVGNFMPMPKLKANNNYGNKTTINVYRRCGNGNEKTVNWYKDYFDRFIYSLNQVFIKIKNPSLNIIYDSVLYSLVEANKFYFDKIDDISKFCEINYIDVNDYCDDMNNIEYKLKEYYTSFDSYECASDIKSPKKDFIDNVQEYITFASERIIKRRELLLETASNK